MSSLLQGWHSEVLIALLYPEYRREKGSVHGPQQK
jgi:hypothetical protein